MFKLSNFEHNAQVPETEPIDKTVTSQKYLAETDSSKRGCESWYGIRIIIYSGDKIKRPSAVLVFLGTEKI